MKVCRYANLFVVCVVKVNEELWIVSLDSSADQVY